MDGTTAQVAIGLLLTLVTVSFVGDHFNHYIDYFIAGKRLVQDNRPFYRYGGHIE